MVANRFIKGRIGLRLWKIVVVVTAVFLLTACLGSASPGIDLPESGAAISAQLQDPTAVLPTVTTPATVQPPPSPTLRAPDPIPPTATLIPPTATLIPPTPAPALTFAVIGDYGSTVQGTQDVAALIRSRDPDLVLTVGDNNYPDGQASTIENNITQHYGRFIEEGRFFPTLGNHDMTTDNGQPYLDYFDLPGNERYYDFVRGEIHFFALNSDWREPDGIRADSRQAQWLQESLAASTAPWQVVYLHVPPYVSMVGKEVPVLRWPFAAWGADLVLSGHAHLYERLQVEGIPYVVNGLGGTTIYPFDDQIRAESQARFNEDFGALFVEGTADMLQMQFITRGGVVVDTHTVLR